MWNVNLNVCVCVCISVCAHAGVQEYVHISKNHQIVKENIRGEETMIEEVKGKNLSNLSTWIRKQNKTKNGSKQGTSGTGGEGKGRW